MRMQLLTRQRMAVELREEIDLLIDEMSDPIYDIANRDEDILLLNDLRTSESQIIANIQTIIHDIHQATMTGEDDLTA